MDAGNLMNVMALGTSVAALLSSVFFSGRQLRISQTANNTMVAVEMLSRERRTDEFMDSEDYVLHRLTTEHAPDEGVYALPIEARRHVTRIALYYNSLGQLAANRAVDPWLVVSTAAYRTRQAWTILEPYVRAERATGSTRYMSHFEHLAHLASEPNRRHLRRLARLRRF